MGNGRHFLGAPKAPGKSLSVAAPLRTEGLRCPVNTLFRPARRVYRAGSRVSPTQTRLCQPLGPGPPHIWTWSTAYLDQVHFYPLDQVQHICLPGPSGPHSLDQVQPLFFDLVRMSLGPGPHIFTSMMQRVTRIPRKTVLLIANRATNNAVIGQNRVTHCTPSPLYGAGLWYGWCWFVI